MITQKNIYFISFIYKDDKSEKVVKDFLIQKFNSSLINRNKIINEINKYLEDKSKHELLFNSLSVKYSLVEVININKID